MLLDHGWQDALHAPPDSGEPVPGRTARVPVRTGR